MPRYDSGLRWDTPGLYYDQPDPIPTPSKRKRIMASNRIPDSLEELMSLAEDAADGAHQLEDTIGLKQNKETNIRADLAELVACKNAYDSKAGDAPAKETAVRVARSNARFALIAARDNFKRFLGAKPSAAWQTAGWPNDSIAVPATSEKLLPLLQSVKAFLIANPTRQIADMQLTPAAFDTLHTALSDAVSGRHNHNSDTGTSKDQRDACHQKLRTRLRGLIDELTQLLEPLSPNWLAFGLKRPGAPDSPETVENTHATALGGGRVRIQSDPAARAEYYQIWAQIGAETEFHLADSPQEPDKILEDFTVGATVKLKVRAVNETGPGRFGEEIQVVVA